MRLKLPVLNISPLLTAVLLLISVVLPDLFFRFTEMRIWNKNYLAFYGLSMLMAFSFYYLAAFCTAKIQNSLLKVSLSIAVAAFITLAVIGSLGYRSYFGNIPTIFTLQLLIEEPAEALVSVQNEFSLVKIVLIILFTALFSFLLYRTRQTNRKINKIVTSSAASLFIGIWLILNNQVRFVDQCFTLDTNILITTSKMIQNTFSTRKFNRTGMHAGTRPKFTSSGKAPGFNLLIIINESVRAADFPLNDSTKIQMPDLTARYKQNPGEYFIFPNAYGTATTTMVAYPTAIAGATSQTEVLALHKLPLLWNYADKYECDRYLTSSHIYYWRNFITFVSDQSLNKIWYQEISGFPVKNGAYGIEDRHTIDTLLNSLDHSLAAKRNFMAVLHTCDQHYPYSYPEKTSNSHTYEDYLQSERQLDRQLTRIESYLKANNIADNTIIIFTSDHGEAFGEHGQYSHIGILHREAASVAFFLKIPSALQLRYDLTDLKNNQSKVISNADLAPTIIDLYNLREDNEVAKVLPQLPGASLLQPLSGNRKVIVSSNTEYAVMRDEHGVGIYGQDESLVFGVTGGQPQFEFYNLKQDPYQTKNCWSGLSDSIKLEYEKLFLTNLNLKRTYDLVIKKSFINFK